MDATGPWTPGTACCWGEGVRLARGGRPPAPSGRLERHRQVHHAYYGTMKNWWPSFSKRRIS